MKVIICDRCGCTDKPVGRAQLASETDSLVFSDVICPNFYEVEGYDICNACHTDWLVFNRERIENFVGKK